MNIENQQAPEETSQAPEETSMGDGSVGGIIPVGPVASPPGDFDESIVFGEEPEAVGDDQVVFTDTGPVKAGLDLNLAKQKAAKMHFALGEKSPGLDVLTNLYASGTEGSLRESLSREESQQQDEFRNQIIREKAARGEPINPDDIAALAGLAKYIPKSSPETVFERKYASALINSAQVLVGGSESPISQGYRQDPERVADTTNIAERLIARQEIIKNVLHDVEGIAKGQSWGGWLVDQAKSFVPLYGTVKLGWGEKRSDSYLRGNIVEDMVNHFWRMPLDDLPTKLREYLFNIAKDNPSLAREVAGAMLSHTSSSQFIDNAFTVIDVASVTPIRTATRAAGKTVEAVRDIRSTRVAEREYALQKASPEAPRAPVTDPAIEATKSIVKANADETPDLPRMLEVMGDPVRASEVTATSRAAEILGQGDASGQAKNLMRTVMDVFRPEKVVTGAPEGIAAVRAERLIEHLKTHSERIATAVTDLVKVSRAPEEAYVKAIQRESQALQEQVIHGGATNDAIISVNWVKPEDTLSNVASVSVSLGKTDGGTFSTVAEAIHYGSQRYGLVVNAANVQQVGQGYVLKVVRNIDETSDAFRESIKTTNNTQRSSLWDTLLGGLRSADDRVSPFMRENRKAAVNAHSLLEKTFKDMISDIGRVNKKEREEVFRVMKADKMETDPAWKAKYAGEEPPRGRFRDTVEDFEVSFARANGGKIPTEAQTKAYFTYRQLNDWDWILRNVGVYRDRARQGYGTVVLKDRELHPDTNLMRDKLDQFIGKAIDDLPYNSTTDASVLIHNAGAEPRRLRLHSIKADATQFEEINRLRSEGYRIVKVENPTRVPFEDRLGKDTVNYIVTKDVELAPLEFTQIPYRPGWHTEYAQPFFVKQPKGRKGGGNGLPDSWIYEGDTSVFGFNTKAEATKYATAMEQARILLKEGRRAELDAFLPKNLPWTIKEFESLFQSKPLSNGKMTEPMLDINSPFFQVESGKYTTDAYGDKLRSHFTGFEDTIRSPHNDFANVDKKFLGQRDNPLWTVSERGSELKPILEFADEIDPGLSMDRTMANIMRTRTFADYKIGQVEAWMSQFSHLLREGIENKELVMSNPTHYIHHGEFVRLTPDNAAELQAAKNSRKAMIELLGTESDFQLRLDSYRYKLMDSIYNGDFGFIGGQEASNKAANWLVHRPGKDPVSTLRHMAFHFNIGLFNPYQLVQNAATMSNAIAIAGPVNGFQGAAAILPMRWALTDERVLDKVSRNMSSFGWKPEWFKESYQELKRTGKWIIEGEHTWKDDISGPSIVQGNYGKFLDSGLFFFKEGERATRLASWNAAYLEWRKANPSAVINDAVRRGLIDRSDLMSANMTRASNASWQQGILSIPGQFLSYHVRLAEQMLGKRLTWQEKARVVGVNSALYGIPIGVFGSSGLGSLTGGLYPAHERIREEMLKRNINMDEGAMQLFSSGVAGLLGNVVSGAPSDLAARMGPGGGHILKSVFEDEAFTKIVFGASGTKGGSIWASMDPVAKFLMNPFRADETYFTPRVEDAVGIIRNIKTVDNAVAVWYAYNAGKAYAKNGQELGDVTTRQMLSQMFVGGGPQKISDMYLKQDILKNRAEVIKKIMDMATKDADSMITALNKGDKTTAELYSKRIAAHMHLGDLTVAEKSKLFTDFYKKQKDKIQTVDWNFIRQAPASQMQQRLEAR